MNDIFREIVLAAGDEYLSADNRVGAVRIFNGLRPRGADVASGLRLG
jgi:hypothetical protein